MLRPAWRTGRRRGRGGDAEKKARRRVGTPPPVFWEKRLEAIENKGRLPEKERQEISRGGKLLKD